MTCPFKIVVIVSPLPPADLTHLRRANSQVEMLREEVLWFHKQRETSIDSSSVNGLTVEVTYYVTAFLCLDSAAKLHSYHMIDLQVNGKHASSDVYI